MNRKKLTALMLSTVMAFTPAAPIVASETTVHSVENAEDIAVSSATASKKNGWDSSKKYYYVNGKKVTNVTKTISKVKYHFDVTGKVVYKKVKNVYYKINSKGKAKKMNQVETLAATRLDMYGGNLKKAFNWSASIPYTANVKVAKKTPGNYGIYGFQRQRGDCYVMAATFYWMAKVSGSDAHYVKGYFKKLSGKGAHAWVEIDYKGTTYVYDPNFQKEYKLNGYKLKYGEPKTLKYIDYKRLN